jgi:hypothetical protein
MGVMDAVTLYAIVTLANGTPGIVKHDVEAEKCEPYARYFRKEHPTAIIWCRSEIDPPRPFIGDHLPGEKVVEYLPDPMDALGMPTAGK